MHRQPMTPYVSVIIPAFNRPEMLEEAVCSVLAQSYHPFELLVVDDGSTVDLSAIKMKVKESGHQWLSSSHQGVSAARNYGYRQARGEFIAFLDSDDLWFPDKLERQIEYMLAHPEFLVTQTEEEWYRQGKFVNPCAHHQKPQGDAFPASLKLCCISPSSVMMVRGVLEQVGLFDETLSVCEDYELWLRVTARYFVGLVDSPLVRKRGGHEDQLSKSQPAMDRFRIYSMVKLLLNTELSTEQTKLVLGELNCKLNVLRMGAAKRKNASVLEACAALEGSLAQYESSRDGERLFEHAQFVLNGLSY